MHLISRRRAALYKQHQIPPRSLAATDELFALTKNLPLNLRQCVSATHSILPCEFQSLFNLAWGDPLLWETTAGGERGTGLRRVSLAEATIRTFFGGGLLGFFNS